MPKANPYAETYPRAGDIALLCEGDVIGYEASILRKWSDQCLGTRPLVDLWPCGTSTALFGFSDALGRSKPLMIVEDRDYRSTSEASTDCKQRKKTRTERGVQIIEWRAWRRNEIENYLAEPSVLLPVMADAFQTTQNKIQDTLAEVLPTLAPFQAVQFALYRVRRAWGKSDPSPILPQAPFHPVWHDSQCKASAPDFRTVRLEMECNLEKWRRKFLSKHTPPDELQGKDFIQDMEMKFEEWRTVTFDDTCWRVDWSGKDVLHWLRIALTAKFGWRNAQTGNRNRTKWENLSRAQREANDRPIEFGLKAFLVTQFIHFVSQKQDSDIHNEWHGIENVLRSGFQSQTAIT